MKKLFTLIELIVVIVVIGILAAIVIPNISSFKEDATTASIESNGKNIQTSVDMFKLENGNLPSLDGKPAVIGSPKQVDFTKLSPEYLRSLPKTGFYWIDYNGEVIYSDTDTPLGVQQKEGKLTWNEPKHGDVESYRIYGVGEQVAGAAKATKVFLIAETDTLEYLLKEEEQGYEDYLVASVSLTGLVSPGISKYTVYAGIDLSETPKGETETGGDTPPVTNPEPEVVPEPVKPVSPTKVGTPYPLEDLRYRSDEKRPSVFKKGDKLEVFYTAESNSTLYKDTFSLDGIRLSNEIIKGTSDYRGRVISSPDSSGYQYIFDQSGKLFKLEGLESKVVMDLSNLLSINYSDFRKVGIEVEDKIAYITFYNDGNGNIILLRVDLTTYTILSNQIVNRDFPTPMGTDYTNIVVTDKYVFTSMLNTHETSTNHIIMMKWDKQTGKFLKTFKYMPKESNQYLSPLLFTDATGELWMIEGRRYLNGETIKLHNVDMETFTGFKKTLFIPDNTVVPSISDTVTHEDGSIQLFYQSSSRFRSISIN